MKISVVESKEIEETQVIIKCKKKDDEILEIEKSLTFLNRVVTGKIEGRNYTLTPSQIYYFESIDNKVFAYTKEQVFDINLKLYQLEDMFENTPFIRINKSTVLNTRKIQSFASSINGRMEAVLKNKERVVISRKYVSILRNMLGGK